MRTQYGHLIEIGAIRDGIRVPRLLSNGRSRLKATLGTHRSVSKCRAADNNSRRFHEIRYAVTVGFFEVWGEQKEWAIQKEGPASLHDRATRPFFPLPPGYPLLGCTPAEPNSVSPGETMITKISIQNRHKRLPARPSENRHKRLPGRGRKMCCFSTSKMENVSIIVTENHPHHDSCRF